MEKATWGEGSAKAFGLRLRAAREAKGKSMEAIGAALNVSKATVGHWETAERAIKHHDLARVCDLLGVSADELLFGVRRWPFVNVDFEAVADLEERDRDRLEGSLMATARELGLALGKRVAA